METIIFAGISLILLIPIVYVLPLSLTFKGKLIVIGAAVAVSLAGVVAAKVYPLWQALLFLSLLLFLALFFIGKKIEPWMLSSQPVADVDYYDRFEKSPVLIESDSEILLTEVEETKVEREAEIFNDTSDDYVAASEEEYIQNMVWLEDQPDDEIIDVFDTEFLKTRGDSLEEAESIPEVEVLVNSELSDIEKLLEDDLSETMEEVNLILPSAQLVLKEEEWEHFHLEQTSGATSSGSNP